MTQSIQRIKASDGSGNANLATVQSTRAPLATTLVVNTVVGFNATSFDGSMGTPHTFTDPVTSETITVISEATCVDFTGHVNGINLVIDTIAPGYTDLGSAIGDIVVIRPTTDWANNVAAVLGTSHNDDGSLIGSAVRTALGETVPTGPGWTSLANTPNTVTALGNRSYSCVFNGVDLTSTLSKGMRLRLTRTVAAPSQCTSLNGTTQFYNKTSPNKLTFTDDFVVSAWIKLNNYGTTSMIASRYNGTSGWYFTLLSDGRIQLAGFNGSSSNFSAVGSYQSVPLNKWVHVAAQLDMSSFTATPTTSYVMIDGVDVPATVSRGGTNPTALIQAGNLEIGSNNGGGNNFPGKIAQVAIYNAKVTEATILASMHQTLIGTETSLASAFSFNNSINDLNATTPNNLTANASAVATNADSPFAQAATAGLIEYGIIQTISFSTNTTIVVQVPEGSAIPTSGGITAVDYSGLSVPYNFPRQKGKWRIEASQLTDDTINFSGVDAWASSNHALSVPIGDWTVGYQIGSVQLHSSVSSSRSGNFTIGSSAPITTGSAIVIDSMAIKIFANSSSDALTSGHKNMNVAVASILVYKGYGYIVSSSGAESWTLNGAAGAATYYADNAWV